MKKLALALVCLFSIAFFASCDPEGQPTIQVLTEEGYVQDGGSVYVNEDFDFGFVMASSPVSNKELSTLVIKIDDEDPDTFALSGHQYTYTGTLLYEYRREEIVGTTVITATVTDVAGQTATASITLTIYQPDQPLEASNIEWVRKGANLIGTTEADMNEIGLQWTGSYKEVFATIKPVDGATMYVCDGADFDGIQNMSDKNAYFTNLAAEGATPAESYRNITTNNDSPYDDMLAIIYGEKLTLVHITYADIETGSYGTQITITGKMK